jgi:hypothetical protein
VQTNRLILCFLLSFIGFLTPLSYVNAVNSHKEKQERVEKEKKSTAEDPRKLDGLSLAAHIATTFGIASLFVLPPLSLLFFTLGFALGITAWSQRRRRYINKRGQGLALTAVILGGTVVTLIAISFVGFLLSPG